MALIDPNRTVTPLRAVSITAAHRTRLPIWCDALVEEQDRWLVLGEGPERTREDPESWVRELSDKSADQLLNDATQSEPARPGAVLMRRARPLRLLAVVHDLETFPTLRPDWVSDALHTIMRLATRTSMRGLALPVLGARDRVQHTEAFAEMLMEAIATAAPARLRIALLADRALSHTVFTVMQETAPRVHIEFE